MEVASKKSNDKKTTNRYLLLGTSAAAILTEMTMFGHPLESIKIIRQATDKPYKKIVNDLIKESKVKGFKTFYKGYYPWAMLQSMKGVPVLYTQSFVSENLYKHIKNEKTVGIIGGLCGGIAQGFFQTPLQRLKTEAMTMNNNNNFNSTHLFKKIINKNGITGLYKGLAPMTLKKGLDWGIRFYGIETFKNNFPEFYQTTPGKFAAGLCGGLLSLTTLPFDVMVAKIQKSESKLDVKQIINLMKQDGFKGFFKGGAMRAVHSSYHTAIVLSCGNLYKEILEDKFCN